MTHLVALPALAQPTSDFVSLVATIPSGLTQPVGIVNAEDGTNRLFIVQQSGKIRVWRDGQLLADPFLNLGSSSGGLNLISDCTENSCNTERGLLGLAFHPLYETNGFFYVYYTRSDGDLVISRYEATNPDDDVADATSGNPLLTIDHPAGNHNGGNLMFRNGLLYIGTGDGGGGGDFAENAQNLNSLLGKLLRLDVDGDDFAADPDRDYAIPPSNPYAGATAGADEVWAWGLRNPWRWSFDRLTGGLYIGDVGQGIYEEIDFESAASAGGVNYGWDCREGAHPFDEPTDNEDCDSPPFQDPILEYDHTLGCSVTGGFVYRGGTSAAIAGQYIFGDHCSGRIWRGFLSGTWMRQELFDTTFNISAFGEDENGKLYFANRSGGAVYRFAPHSFLDVTPDTKPWPAIESLYLAGVSLGCDGSHFCGDGTVQRQQIAAQLVRAQDPEASPGGCGAAPYTDVGTGSAYCPWISALKDQGVALTCGDANHFCPTAPVTRGVLAPLLLKAVNGGAFTPTPDSCTADEYTDVLQADPLCPWIREAAEQGLLPACDEAGNVFCRDAPVRRDQLAALFLGAFPVTIPEVTP